MSMPAIAYQVLVFPCVILPFAAMHTHENSPWETFDDMDTRETFDDMDMDCEEASPASLVSSVHGATLRDAASPSFIRSPSIIRSPSFIRSPSPVASHGSECGNVASRSKRKHMPYGLEHMSECKYVASRSNRKHVAYGLESQSLLAKCVERISKAHLKVRRAMYQSLGPHPELTGTHYSYSERIVACLAEVSQGWLHKAVCSRRAAGRHIPTDHGEDESDSASTVVADDLENNSDTDPHAAVTAGWEVERAVDTQSASDTTLRNLVRIALGEASYGSGSGYEHLCERLLTIRADIGNKL